MPVLLSVAVLESHTVTPESLVFLRRFSRSAAPNVKPDTKFTKNAKRTKNGEGHEEGCPLFVFFLPFFVVFVSFVLGVWLRPGAALSKRFDDGG